MDAQAAIDLGREAIWSGLISIGPILLVGLLATIGLGVLQSMFQVHESAIATIPKLALMLLTIMLCLPWLSDRMVDLGRRHFERPLMMSGSNSNASSSSHRE